MLFLPGVLMNWQVRLYSGNFSIDADELISSGDG